VGVSHAAQLGIAKSNQLNQLFANLSVRQKPEDCRAGATPRPPMRLRFAEGGPTGLPEVEKSRSVSVLGLLDLVKRADTPAHILAYGEKRRLEIGMALATSPNVLLLERARSAGMSPAETCREPAPSFRDIARSRTIVIVEHDLRCDLRLGPNALPLLVRGPHAGRRARLTKFVATDRFRMPILEDFHAP